MKAITTLFLTCGVLAGIGYGAETVTGDFQDHFDQATLQPAWQSHQVVNGAALPTGWRLENGLLRGKWGANWGQEHLTVETSMTLCPSTRIPDKPSHPGTADTADVFPEHSPWDRGGDNRNVVQWINSRYGING